MSPQLPNHVALTGFCRNQIELQSVDIWTLEGAVVRHSGEHARISTHENSRQRRHMRADLPLRAPRRGSGKYETIPFHPPPPAAPVKHDFGGSRSTRLVALTSFGFIVGLCRFRRLSLGVVRLREFPSRHAL